MDLINYEFPIINIINLDEIVEKKVVGYKRKFKFNVKAKEFIPCVKRLKLETIEDDGVVVVYLDINELSALTKEFEKSMKTGWGMGCVVEQSKNMKKLQLKN